MESRDRPSRRPRRINRIVARLAALGLTPRTTIALDVPGRRTGRRQRVALTWTRHGEDRFLVSLAGESSWVRNVRAAGGHAIIRHGRSVRVRLEEVPVDQRAPILQSYLGRWALSKSPSRAARDYFGLPPRPTQADLARVAARYPVFRIVDDKTLS